MGFNLAFKGLILKSTIEVHLVLHDIWISQRQAYAASFSLFNMPMQAHPLMSIGSTS